MEILSDTTLVILSVLGLVLIIIGIVIPYFIYQINCELKEIRKEVKNLRNTSPPETGNKSRWGEKLNWK